MTLYVVPLTLAQANEIVRKLHRHHKEARGHRFSIGCIDQHGSLHGAAIVGRPVSRGVEQFAVAEVSRLVTDGQRNACSLLYASAARAAQAMGFDRIQTYILESETGISLRAAGWTFEAVTNGGDWNDSPRRGTRRVDQPMERKQRWSRVFRDPLPLPVGSLASMSKKALRLMDQDALRIASMLLRDDTLREPEQQHTLTL